MKIQARNLEKGHVIQHYHSNESIGRSVVKQQPVTDNENGVTRFVATPVSIDEGSYEEHFIQRSEKMYDVLPVEAASSFLVGR